MPRLVFDKQPNAMEIFIIKRIQDLILASRLIVVFGAAVIGCVCDGQTPTPLHVINPDGPAGLQELLHAVKQPAELEVRYRDLLETGVDTIESDRPLQVDAMLFGATLTAAKSVAMETVKVAPDENGFIFHPSGERYIPWGHNYASVDIMQRLANDPARVEREFAEMRAAGTTVARIHPEMPRFLVGPKRADPVALDQLGKLLMIAEKSGIHLKITGLACYQINDRMAWYDSMDEQQRWETQAFFGRQLPRRVPTAQRCSPMT